MAVQSQIIAFNDLFAVWRNDAHHCHLSSVFNDFSQQPDKEVHYGKESRLIYGPTSSRQARLIIIVPLIWYNPHFGGAGAALITRRLLSRT